MSSDSVVGDYATSGIFMGLGKLTAVSGSRHSVTR